MIAKGNIVIRAVEGLKIDIKDVNKESVSQTIDTMVKADPQLAWFKDAELNPYVTGKTRPVRFEDAVNNKGDKSPPAKEALEWFNSIKWD